MHRLRLTWNLRTLAFLSILLIAIAAPIGLWWLNRSGLPESWRDTIEGEIAKQGAHISIGALSYNPFRGIIASKVKVYEDASRKKEIAKLERVIIDLDKTRLARGVVQLAKIELKDAGLTLAVRPDDPNSELLEIRHASGTLLMPGDRRLEIRNTKGNISGIEVSLDARIIGYTQDSSKSADQEQLGQRRELIAKIIKQLNTWQFDPSSPPRLGIYLEGDANRHDSFRAKLTLDAENFGKNQHTLDTLKAEAELADNLLTIHSIKASDRAGELDARADYDIVKRQGRFDVVSSVEIAPLVSAWLNIDAPDDLHVDGPQQLEANGEFQLQSDGPPHIEATGRASLESIVFRDTYFDRFSGSFAKQGPKFFLKDIHIISVDGEAKGKLLIDGPMRRIAIDSTLPAKVFRPFFIGKPLAKVIDDFSERENAKCHVVLEGSSNAQENPSWRYEGKAKVENMNFRGVPLVSAACDLGLSPDALDFTNGTVVFNYRDYPLRDAFNGKNTGTAEIERIRYDRTEKIVEVVNVRGPFWAAPLVRLFASKVADDLEVYRFHQPPNIRGSGKVDVTPEGRTALDITFDSDTAANYIFLGKEVTLTKPSATIGIRNRRVLIDKLKAGAFDGQVNARYDFLGDGKLDGEMSWNSLSIPGLSDTYGLNMKGGGKTNGRIGFTMSNRETTTMNGDGLVAMEETELFSVPMFGPLSPLISTVLNNRNAGFEHAANASCNFTIRNGILSTRDFKTSTKSLSFTGDGSVNLDTQAFDMTMRMNARGLLGIITLPLKPFYGMFQFRGSGPLKKPTWESVMFSPPPEAETSEPDKPPKVHDKVANP
ncbi:MAG: AsmA-like C-terminal region-containing protein [Luteolibacter sp.]